MGRAYTQAFTVKQAAAECGVTTRTIRRWVEAGRLTPVYRKARVYFRVAQVRRVMRERGAM